MIAAIRVEAIAMPMLPRRKERKKRSALFIAKVSKKKRKRSVIEMFIKKTSKRLKNSLPVKIVDGAAIELSNNDVPLSSSETDVRESPDIAEKKTTTQSKPAVKYSEMVSLPTENRIILMVTSTNIAKALIA